MLTLEEVREQLEQKGAFDRFKKKKRDDECEMETKISMLKQAMKNHEENTEPFLEIEPCNHILSDVEAKDLSMFFSKKEIDDLILKKYPAIKPNLPIRSILIKLSETGNIPKKPLRVVTCQKCGMSKELAIDLCAFWDMQKKYYCESCQKEIDALNKPKTQQTGLI